VLGVSIAAVFVGRHEGGEIGGRFSSSPRVRISPHCEEVLELLVVSDLGFDLLSLEFATPWARENNDGGCSRS
jgi:hypothetical protein